MKKTTDDFSVDQEELTARYAPQDIPRDGIPSVKPEKPYYGDLWFNTDAGVVLVYKNGEWTNFLPLLRGMTRTVIIEK